METLQRHPQAARQDDVDELHDVAWECEGMIFLVESMND